MKRILLYLSLLMIFTNCEKDDICDSATPTTPQLVVEFFDVANPTTLKSVTNLVIVGDGVSTGIGFTGVSKIKIPLNTNTDTVSYTFIQNGSDDNANNNNEDRITINYSRNLIYVSRACGYKNTFNINTPNGIILFDGVPLDGFWIQNIIIQNPIIESENETHVKMYF